MTEDALTLYKSPEGYAKLEAFYEAGLAKIPVPVESRYVQTRFGQAHMLTAGPEDAPPLLLMKGMAGSAILWHQQFADFARQCRVYALDTPGQPGRSAPYPPSFFDDSFAHWLADVLDGLGLDRADMAGVSLGGWAIFRLGIIAPERLRRAVLISPLRLARARTNIRRYIGNAVRPEKKDESLEDRLSVRDFNPGDGTRVEYDRQLARAMALATKHYRLGYAMGMRPEQNRLQKFWTGLRTLRLIASPAPPAELAAFRVPALVVLGEHEMLYSSAVAAERARMMPNAEVVVVNGAGHAAIYDRPQEINPVILEFLARPV